MRRLTPALVSLLLSLVLLTACRREHPRVDTIEDENQPPLSAVAANDPRGAPQLLSGFYDVEDHAWRWTMGKFSLILQPPAGAAQKGARLTLELAAPEPVLARRKAITLSVAVEGQPLAPETYAKSGQYTYSRDVPASLLGTGPVKIDFTLDKFLAANEIETRELGLIVRRVALDPK